MGLGQQSRYVFTVLPRACVCRLNIVLPTVVVLYIDTTESVRDASEAQPQPCPLILQRPDTAAFAVVCGNSTQVWDLLQLRPLSEPVPLPVHIQWIAPLHSTSGNQTAFTLAAIARDGSLVLVGDDVSLPEHEGAVERTLSKSGTTRLSLFEDVFGRSAFRDLEDQVEGGVPRVEVDSTDYGAGIDLRLLDGPAYLLPPIETLFSSLMDGILKRSKEEADSDARLGGGEVEAMEVDEVDELPEKQAEVKAVSSARVVDQAEMDMLVQLFQEHCAVPG